MSQRVIIVGGVALGPKAACRLKRLQPDAEVTIVDQQKLLSYGGCGIPYFVSGDVSDYQELQSTSYNVVRDPDFFSQVKGVQVLPETKALKINRQEKTLLVKDLPSGEEKELPYDQLVLATGSNPRQLPIPGNDLPGVFYVSNLEDAVGIKGMIAAGKVSKAVIVGAGFIGLEMAEALADMWGIETAVVELCDQVMPGVLSKELAQVCQTHLEEKEVDVYLKEKVVAVEGSEGVQKIITDKREIEAELLIISAGIIPNTQLAKDAGLDVSGRGTIIVNKMLQTSDPNIYSGGDCVQVEHLVTGKPFFLPLGSIANRQGRVIGSNLAGHRETFPGVVGTFIVKTFDLAFAGAGLNIEAAKREGFNAFRSQVIQFDRSHFYPEKDLMILELVAEKGTGRVLGVHGSCPNGDALKARIDSVAAMLPYHPTVYDVANMEGAYAPPFSSAMDVINAAANTAENIIAGRNIPIETEEFKKLWEQRKEKNLVFLDTRSWPNAEPFCTKHPDYWINIPTEELRKRLDEVPRDREIVLVCNTGNRSFEAQLLLRQSLGIETVHLQGGLGVLHRWGMDPSLED